MPALTQYTKSGDVGIAYQIVCEGYRARTLTRFERGPSPFEFTAVTAYQ